jgi:hypothetical protein
MYMDLQTLVLRPWKNPAAPPGSVAHKLRTITMHIPSQCKHRTRIFTRLFYYFISATEVTLYSEIENEGTVITCFKPLTYLLTYLLTYSMEQSP